MKTGYRTTLGRLACITVSLLFAGCASIVSVTGSRDPSPYSGVRLDCQEISHCREYWSPPWLLVTIDTIDLPLSACADTILLPYTIPHTGESTNMSVDAESGNMKQGPGK